METENSSISKEILWILEERDRVWLGEMVKQTKGSQIIFRTRMGPFLNGYNHFGVKISKISISSLITMNA